MKPKTMGPVNIVIKSSEVLALESHFEEVLFGKGGQVNNVIKLGDVSAVYACLNPKLIPDQSGCVQKCSMYRSGKSFSDYI